MDDFGVGYSTLNTLGTLPVDIIKFDKGFISNSMNNEAVYQILQSLIHVFRQINYDVICEGIETKEQEKLILNVVVITFRVFCMTSLLKEIYLRTSILRNNLYNAWRDNT